MISEIDKRYFLFSVPPKEIGSIGKNDISKRCDICGDGTHGKKRLHLYTKPSFDKPAVGCFNCGYSSNLYGYLKEYHPDLYSNYLKETLGQSFKKLVSKKKQIEENTTELESFNLDELSSQEFKVPNTIQPISLPGLPEEVQEYLRLRGLEEHQYNEFYYSPLGNKVVFEDKEILLSEYIIIPLVYNNKWYGFQALAWKEKRFLIYLVQGNTSFKVWNFFKVNRNEPVYIFESIYDALSSGLSNVISTLGATIHEDRLKELKEPVFCLDNNLIDKKSREESLKLLKKGYKCLVWPDGSEAFKDTNDLRKKNVPFEKIRKMIESNIYQGLSGYVKLKTKPLI